MSKETGIGLVATGDCHYVRKEDWKSHNILMCIQQNKTVHDKDKLEHSTPSYYIQSPEEFNQKFSDVPEALESTCEIAKRCNVELELGKTYLPKYGVPEGYDLD